MLTQEDKLTIQIDGTKKTGHYYLQEGSWPISMSPPISFFQFQQKSFFILKEWKLPKNSAHARQLRYNKYNTTYAGDHHAVCNQNGKFKIHEAPEQQVLRIWYLLSYIESSDKSSVMALDQ